MRFYQLLKSKFVFGGVITGLLSGFFWSLNNIYYYKAYNNIANALDIMVNTNVVIAILFIPLLCSAINDLVAGICITIYNYKRRFLKRFSEVIFTKSGVIISLAGLIGGPIGQLSYFVGIALAGPAYSLIITSFYPIIGSIFSIIILKEKIRFHMWIGLCSSIAGAIIIGLNPAVASTEYFIIGIIFSIIATLSWGLEIVLAVLGMKDIDPNIAINIREIISGLTLLIIFISISIGYGIPISSGVFNNIEYTTLLFLFLSGILAGCSYFFWYATNSRLGCAKGMVLNSTFLLWGIFIGVVFGIIDNINLNMIIGSILILIGVVFVLLNPFTLFVKNKSYKMR